MELTQEQADYLNGLLDEASQKIKGLILIDGYQQSPLTDEDQIKANRAIDIYKEVLSYVPDHYASWMFMGKVYQRLKEYAKALECLDSAVNLTDSHIAPQEAALVAMGLGEYEKAVTYGEEALCRNPTSIAVLGHAMNLMHIGKDKEALIAIDRAIELSPEDEINKNVKKLIVSVMNGEKPRPTFNELVD